MSCWKYVSIGSCQKIHAGKSGSRIVERMSYKINARHSKAATATPTARRRRRTTTTTTTTTSSLFVLKINQPTFFSKTMSSYRRSRSSVLFMSSTCLPLHWRLYFTSWCLPCHSMRCQVVPRRPRTSRISVYFVYEVHRPHQNTERGGGARSATTTYRIFLATPPLFQDVARTRLMH